MRPLMKKRRRMKGRSRRGGREWRRKKMS
jgi:hypothetical protein